VGTEYTIVCDMRLVQHQTSVTVHAAEHQCLLAGSKLQCLVTKRHTWVALNHYAIVRWLWLGHDTITITPKSVATPRQNTAVAGVPILLGYLMYMDVYVVQ